MGCPCWRASALRCCRASTANCRNISLVGRSRSGARNRAIGGLFTGRAVQHSAVNRCGQCFTALPIKNIFRSTCYFAFTQDRLGRAAIALLTLVKQIADRGCLFKSLADPRADTTTPAGRLMLTVLGGLAEFERELIKARTTEGRARAKTRGVHMGRPPKLTVHQKREALNALAVGSVSQADMARRFNVSQTTI